MAFDDDPMVRDWFDTVLQSSVPDVRIRALELLTRAQMPLRDEWLSRAASDADADVRATAVLVAAAIAAHDELPNQDLMESDFASGLVDAQMQWEWEYTFVPCIGSHIPTAGVSVWTADEDDACARRLALLRASAGRPGQAETVLVMVGKHFVNKYTRSPRSFAEAVRWRMSGRPRYGRG